jgi:hypothetical protein
MKASSASGWAMSVCGSEVMNGHGPQMRRLWLASGVIGPDTHAIITGQPANATSQRSRGKGFYEELHLVLRQQP